MAVLGRGAGTGLAEGMATGSVSHLFVARRGGRNKADRRAPTPALPRTTGAGFCYNFGRIAAGLGTVFFGLFAKVGDYRLALLWAGFLFLPAAGIALLLPEPPDEKLL